MSIECSRCLTSDNKHATRHSIWISARTVCGATILHVTAPSWRLQKQSLAPCSIPGKCLTTDNKFAFETQHEPFVERPLSMSATACKVWAALDSSCFARSIILARTSLRGSCSCCNATAVASQESDTVVSYQRPSQGATQICGTALGGYAACRLL